MKRSMQVKILKQFPNPLTNRKTKIGQKMSVPKDIFWMRRVADKDCEEIKEEFNSKPKAGSTQKSKQQ